MYHQLLTLFETPEQRRQSTNIHGVGSDRHEMVEHTRDLTEHCSDPLRTFRDIDVEQLLNSKRVALLVGHNGDVIETIEVRKSLIATMSYHSHNNGEIPYLEVGLVLNQLLSSTMKQTNMRIRTNDLFTL